MAFDLYMLIDGIPGSCDEKKHEDYCKVLSFQHSIDYPFDMSGNIGRSEVKHQGLTVVKPIDKASPLLYQKLCYKDEIAEIKVEWWRDKPGGGKAEHYFTTILSDCRVVHLRQFISLSEDSRIPPHAEEVGFGYRNIRWVFEPSGIEAEWDFTQVT
jgi:type VI secretion system secreted protein Hcp